MAEDENTRNEPAPAPAAKSRKSDAFGATRDREARLAAALRANLRRRKGLPGQGE